LDVVSYFVSQRSRVADTQRSIAARSVRALIPGRVKAPADVKVRPVLHAFVAEPRVRRFYTVDQALLPAFAGNIVEAKCTGGVVELPSIGYFRVDAARRVRAVSVRVRPHVAIATAGVKGTFFPATTIHPAMEVLNHIPAAFRMLFGPRHQGVKVSSVPARLQQLSRALALLEQAGALEIVTDVTRSILLFGGVTKNSFYDPRAHGAIFIRFSRSHDELHLVEEIIHQAGHAAFSILTLAPERYLRVPPGAALGRLTSERDEYRSVLVAFHGLVTEALISEALQRIYSATASPLDRHAIAGRLAFATQKLAADLHAFAGCAEILATEGLVLLRTIASTYERIVRAYGPRLRRVNLTSQPYVFSRARYLARNPLPTR
jgi:hypothetical protein